MRPGPHRALTLALLLACLVIAIPSAAAGTATNNFRVSIAGDGTQGNERSDSAGITPDGRSVAFASNASNLVPGDTNQTTDVFVHDRTTRTTTRMTLSSWGAQINRPAHLPAISADSRFVAFTTSANNLVAGDLGFDSDVFVHDRLTGATTAASVNSSGELSWCTEPCVLTNTSPSLSADGRYVAFESNADNFDGSTNDGIFVHDQMTGATTRVSVNSAGAPAVRLSKGPALSADGRFVAFQSDAANLVLGDTNGVADIFVRDRVAGTTERVNVSSSGAQTDQAEIDDRPAITPDGRFVAFSSSATNLVDGDTNGLRDVFVRDRATGRTERVSLSNRGQEARRYSGSGGSFAASMSADARFVSFTSYANDLVDNDSWPLCCDVFVRDRANRTTVRVTIPTGGGTPARGSGTSGAWSMNGDGHLVALSSDVPLGPGDTNGVSDVYVHDLTVAATPTPAKGGAPVTVSVAKRGPRAIVRGSAALCCGSRITGSVAVRLFAYQKRNKKFVVVARKTARLDDAGRYTVSFRRPKARRCKVAGHFIDTAFFAGGTTIRKFRC
jgi:Tol biopolymer transport system component